MNNDGMLAYEHNGQPVPRERFYAIACDPRRSVAVEACAGAGKTWMLVSRVLRALLDGAQPHEILAITFTKKAAGEMRQRLQEWLQEYSQAPTERLQEALVQRGIDGAAALAYHEPLRGLQRRLLSGGRSVQVRTFHSWFAALLRNAPLTLLAQLGLPARYELLEDDSQAVARVWRSFYAVVAADPEAREDFQAAVSTHGRHQTHKALLAALSKRVEFALADQAGVVEGSVRRFDEQFAAFAGLPEPVAALSGSGARDRWLTRARSLGAEANKAPQSAAQSILAAFETQDLHHRFSLLRGAFFVAGEDRLKVLLAKFPAAQEAGSELERLCAANAQHEAWEHQQRMARLARLLIAQFAAIKRERGWIDMNDLEQAALVMLADPVLSGWVQERLDARVRHLLVDEFQDTNPLQWQALYAWLSGYAGAGGTSPSVFIVGDPKQSIYRFRRAEPQVFRAAQHFIAQGLQGDLLSCDHTHRNSNAVISLVNRVMTDAQAGGEYADFRPHTSESRVSGSVRHLPQVERDGRPAVVTAAGPAGWRDSLTVPRELPEEKLVTLECRQAAAWIAMRISQGLASGDIMVLARKRDRLAVMEDELRALGIAAQQPEKTALGEAPEVQDLVALLDLLVSPTHDLSLARVLKSPIFGADDASLVAIAVQVRRARAEGRSMSWLEVLRDPATLPPALADAAVALQRWAGWVERLPPHDALDAIFHDGDVLARYAQAAPPALRGAVLANLRALLGAALQVDGGRYLTPYAFVRALRAGGVQGPSLSAPGAVQLLTVHGAKGLEASLVLILDTDGPPARGESMGILVDWPGAQAAPLRFAFMASEARPSACSAPALAVEQAAREREELNALYVAMTRARAELVLSSVQPHVAAQRSWWQRLTPFCEPVPEPELVAARVPVGGGPGGFVVLPWVPAPPLPSSPTPAEALRHSATPESRFGEAVHRLLEHRRPADNDWPGSQLDRVAREFDLGPAAAEQAAAMSMRIVSGEGAWAWDPAHVDWAGNEVALHHRGELLRLDRLVRRRTSGEWWVLDYKSLSRPEADTALLLKMARYREAVATVHPGTEVKAAFLTGQGRLVVVE